MRKLLVILAVAMLLVLAGCGTKEVPPKPEPKPAPEVKPAPEPVVETAGEAMVDEIGALDGEVEDLSVDGLDDLDSALADLESLDI